MGATGRFDTHAVDAPCGFSLGAAVRDGNEALLGTLARADADMYAGRARRRSAAAGTEV